MQRIFLLKKGIAEVDFEYEFVPIFFLIFPCSMKTFRNKWASLVLAGKIQKTRKNRLFGFVFNFQGAK